ncbi:MAG: hypothetical protein ACK50T_00650 [Sphingobacteriia bacterium]
MIELLKTYLEHRIRLLGLRLQYQGTVVLAVLGYLALVLVPLLLAFLLLCLALGYGLGSWLGHVWLGFAIAGIFCGIISLLLYLCRSRIVALLQQLIDRKLTQSLAQDDTPDRPETTSASPNDAGTTGGDGTTERAV